MNAKQTLRVGVIGANGYTGGELLRLLANHPYATTTIATSRSQADQPLGTVFANLTGAATLPDRFTDADPERIAQQCDVAFACLPHGESQQWVADLLELGVTVIDLSADFRYNDIAVYEESYVPHAHPELAATAVYGLPEWSRDELAGAKLIAVPGCYPTSVLLGLLPLAKANMLPKRIVIDSQSGVTGAGRKAKLNLLHGEISESLQAYGLPTHRHESEMRYQLQRIGGQTCDVLFTPHLAPINRGIISTMHIELDGNTTVPDVQRCLADSYTQASFVKVLDSSQLPKTAAVRGTNFVHLRVVQRRDNVATILSVIDNLGKGAAGQAVQCLNLVAGWEESAGLKQLAVLP